MRRLMRQLAENGVNDLYESFAFRPHITLTEFSTNDFAAVLDRLHQVAVELDPVEVRFSSLGIFPGAQGVFHLIPTVSPPLLEMHRTIQNALDPLCQDFSPLYQEAEWVPHCTLVVEMDPLELPRIYQVMVEHFKPFNTRLVALEVITCCPFRTVLSQDFRPPKVPSQDSKPPKVPIQDSKPSTVPIQDSKPSTVPSQDSKPSVETAFGSAQLTFSNVNMSNT